MALESDGTAQAAYTDRNLAALALASAPIQLIPLSK